MRLRSPESRPTVAVAEGDSIRPVRIRTGGLTFCMTTTEAIHLANELADAITEINRRAATS